MFAIYVQIIVIVSRLQRLSIASGSSETSKVKIHWNEANYLII